MQISIALEMLLDSLVSIPSGLIAIRPRATSEDVMVLFVIRSSEVVVSTADASSSSSLHLDRSLRHGDKWV